jgi:hypothetical protein
VLTCAVTAGTGPDAHQDIETLIVDLNGFFEISLLENEIHSGGCGFLGQFLSRIMVSTNNQIQNHHAIVCALVFH